MTTVDLNCDMGESFGAWSMGDDSAIMPWITSANIACGFHAGDPRTIDATVLAAKERGIGIGAHPGFPDLVGFGRRNMTVTYREAYTDVLYQIGALAGFCRVYGVRLRHVKPHGQLNNLAMTNGDLAEAIVDAVCAFDRSLVVVTYGGELARMAQQKGLTVAWEAYADRAYQNNGLLAPRLMQGAVIHDPDEVAERALAMVIDHRVTTIDGGVIEVHPATLCIHGDTPGAAGLAERVHRRLLDAGIVLAPLGPERRDD